MTTMLHQVRRHVEVGRPGTRVRCPARSHRYGQATFGAIRAKLQLEKRTRDLAMFNLAIDRKLRGCDLVALRVDDVAPNGYTKDRANVRQQKTGRPVRFELTESTRETLDNYLRGTNRKAGEYLFPGGRNLNRPLSTRQYARLVSK